MSNGIPRFQKQSELLSTRVRAFVLSKPCLEIDPNASKVGNDISPLRVLGVDPTAIFERSGEHRAQGRSHTRVVDQ
ncbi:hypothetical protein [Gordonia araii]|uniref:hypothetical protein n=1 Tax=Gordonia araii TaxID=263909 RepID=UPI00058F1D1E|nr:hypothetical protein [Gordonia araii]NNG96274.1 hypothetical protein [Gordonia araii NBRC 100433]